MNNSRQKIKKKNHKLLFQVSIVTLVLFIISMAAISIFTIRKSNEYYYHSKTGNLARNADSIMDVTGEPYLFVWFLDYLRNHEIDYDYLINYDNQEQKLAYTAIYTINMGSQKYETPEEINRILSSDQQKALGYLYLRETNRLINYQLRDANYDEIYLIDVSEDDFGYLYFDTENDRIAQEVRDSHVIQEAFKNGTDSIFGETVYEITQGDEMILNSYSPIFENGKARAALILRYNCTDFYSMQYETIRMMLLTGVIALLITDILLMLFIYRKAVRPITAVKRVVLSYKTDKDSKKTIGEMQRIKSRNEVGVLADSFSEMAGELDSYISENLRLTAEKERVAAEFELAAKIQLDMLPTNFPKHSGFELFASMTPAKEVGGDFYDFFMTDDDHLCLVIADVSGKGIPAALFMMKSKLIIKENALSGGTPGQILRKANHALCEDNTNMMFVTVWLGILEISSGKLTAANAGHEYPVIRQPGKNYQLLKDKHGAALGVFDHMTYKDYEISLPKGGTLFVYTDGIDEATNADNELFKSERLLAALNHAADHSPKDVISEVRGAVDRFVGEAPQFDDMTMLCIRIK